MDEVNNETIGFLSIDLDFAQGDGGSYDGTAPLIEGASICNACGLSQDECENELLRCSRCHVVYYCSVLCQREDFEKHKRPCKALAKLEAFGLNPTPEEKAIVDQAGPPGSPEHEMAFLKMATDGPQAMINVGFVLRIMASQKYGNTRTIWEKSLHTALEIMPIFLTRQTQTQFPGHDKDVVFALLYLNRDDDVMSYCKHWMQVGDASDLEGLALTIKNNEPIFSQEEGALQPRFEDIIADTTDIDDVPIHYLMAVCIVKMRLVAKYTSMLKEATENNESKSDIEKVLVEQEAQLKTIMVQIQAKNSLLLPGLLDYVPLVQDKEAAKDPVSSNNGSSAEAREILMLSINLVRRIPGMDIFLRDNL